MARATALLGDCSASTSLVSRRSLMKIPRLSAALAVALAGLSLTAGPALARGGGGGGGGGTGGGAGGTQTPPPVTDPGPAPAWSLCPEYQPAGFNFLPDA